MFITTEIKEKSYVRYSKLGIKHEYTRSCTYVVLRCDNCSDTFSRPKGSMSVKRMSNHYFHCCDQCDAKKFAQKKGVERRRVWDLPASSMIDISRL